MVLPMPTLSSLLPTSSFTANGSKPNVIGIGGKGQAEQLLSIPSYSGLAIHNVSKPRLLNNLAIALSETF